jgi:hypothetical protein
MATSTSFLAALPPYPGGKRRFLPAIFGLIDSARQRASWPGLTFVEPFLGGGAVALTAKALGFGRVAANDLAARSVIVGRALLENSTTTLTPHDVLQLFQASAAGCSRNGDLLERLPAPLAEFLASAWTHVQSCPPPKDDLARLLLIRWVLSFGSR